MLIPAAAPFCPKLMWCGCIATGRPLGTSLGPFGSSSLLISSHIGSISWLRKGIRVLRYWRLHPTCMDGRPLSDEEMEDPEDLAQQLVEAMDVDQDGYVSYPEPGSQKALGR